MPNELIFILTVLIYLGSVLGLYKVFGKNGLYAFGRKILENLKAYPMDRFSMHRDGHMEE